jgi:dihydrofolate synthase / folylpolyglutamate synthase
MTFDESLAWLNATQLHGIKLGLGNIERLVAELGIRAGGEGSPRFLHVAGTNGKGSVCAMLDSICRAAGLRTGLYTSPHLLNFRERIRVDGAMIGKEDLAAGLTRIRELTADWEHSPTFFEITTALALMYFQHQAAEIVVLETGMGGRLDATNVVMPNVSVITPIFFDHQQYLGSTLPEIALEKAGIIKPHVPVVAAWQREEVLRVLGHVALERRSPFHIVVTPLRRVEIALAGKHQEWNAALAAHALEVGGIAVPEAAIVRGLRDVRWPGRFQRVGDRMILDGAHNPAAARQLAETWRETFGVDARATLVLGTMRDKDLRRICESLAPLAARVFAVPVRNPRSCTPQELAEQLREVAPDCPCTLAPNVETGLRLSQNYTDRILVTGSLFLVGEALAHLASEPPPTPSAQ